MIGYRVVSLCLILFLALPLTSFAQETDGWKKLDIISDQALQMTKQERYEDAKALLQYFSDEFIKVNAQYPLYKMDELRVITVTHNEAMEAVSSSSLKSVDRIQKVTQFRLVIDAIRSEHQPLWTEMENSIMTAFNQMKETIEKGDNDGYQHYLTMFMEKYSTIHPSLLVDISSTTVQKLDSHINFLDNYRDVSLKQKTRMQQLQQMELDLKEVFDKMTEDDADPSLIWVMISTGSIIILTLTYVGWRKYKGDKQKKETQRDVDK
ncbi:sporulation protein YpjB [Bacillus timonensis]|nr:sporulation protein YpjB [Bacillus timonensis]